MMKQFYLTILIFFVGLCLAFGQSLKGIVTDHQKRGIEGAYILHVQTGNHVHTSLTGDFVFVGVKTGDTLQVSHLGYQTQQVLVEDLTSELIVRMKQVFVSLDEIQISPTIEALELFSTIDIQTNPVNSSQEVLRKVPGLIIGQHAGGGKAEQIFLRGFDIDHGTDINITVDGLPVNMVSHAHGQGYADLHFLIPETVDGLSFGKGPYNAAQGNFATAGFVAFKTKDRLDNSQLKLEVGEFDTQRLLGMFNVLDTERQTAYLASEYLATDGPFDSPQNFDRINLMGKYTSRLPNNDKLSVLASYFTSQWDASGQIPQRAVDDGSISRFGAIDDTEGGQTSRTNVLADHVHTMKPDAFIKNSVYFSSYDFELYSNFTFFLNDPVNGDQIKQKESRKLFGMNSEFNQQFDWGNSQGRLQAGVGLRKDQSSGNELSHTANRRETIEQLKLGEIHETNLNAYVNAAFDFGKWTINPALRVDHFKFNYNDELQDSYLKQSESQAIVSPKLNILYHSSDWLQLYAKFGKGFHSNDTRGVVAQNGQEILPAAYGSDLGLIWKPMSSMMVNLAYWYLFLEQEFVYVGDEGVVEPSGKTRRTGLDLSLRYQPLSWLFWDLDANYTLARATEEADGEDYIPLAPDFTLISGLSVVHPEGWYGGLKLRHINDRPANEDNSIVAAGYSVIDFNVGHQWPVFDVSLSIQNLLDTKWNETQFATETRLQNEANPVEEIHFIPGTPRFIKISVAYKF